jgi:hypothetical protein
MGEAVAVGLMVRTGRAVVVVLRGTRGRPQIAVRQEIQLADPRVPGSMHPYHLELDEPGPAGVEARGRACAAALEASERAIGALVNELQARGHEPTGAAIVASSLTPPERIAGAHARAHAEEGALFRRAVEDALATYKVPTETVPAKMLEDVATKRLGQDAHRVAATLKAFSREVGPPWRAYEKQAALAAWCLLPAMLK